MRFHRPSRTTTRALAALVTLMIGAGVPAVASAAGWTPARPVFPPASPGVADPQIAVAGDGSALAAWGRPDYFAGPFQSAALAPGASAWGPVQTAPGYNDWLINDIRLRLDRHANAVATWTNVHTSGGSISASTRPANGAWSESQFISKVPWPGEYGLAVDPDGKAIAVWPANNWSGAGPTAARVKPPGAVWGAVSDLVAPPGPAEDIEANNAADVALDPAGRAVAAWAQTVAGVTTVYAAWRPAGGPWGPAQPVAGASQSVTALKVGINAAGTATVVWGAGDYPSGDVFASRASWNGPAWEPAAGLSGGVGGLQGGALQLTVDPGGKAIAIWTEWGSVTAAIRPVGSGWRSRQTLSAAGGSDGVVALDAAGNAVAAWQREVGASSVVEATTRPQGADWSPAKVLSAAGKTGSEPAAAMSPDGSAMVVWKQGDDLNRGVAFAVNDVTPPSLSGVSVPGSARVGAPVSVSMGAPQDRWSTVEQVGWDFGDGSLAGGTAAVHAYAAAGTYTVTARAVDAAGNATTQTRQVIVTTPPLLPPPAGSQPSSPGTTGSIGGVSAGLPGASAGTSPVPASGSRGPVRKGTKRVTLGVSVPRSLRVGTRSVIHVGIDRAVRGALIRVQLRQGVLYRTIAQGRVSGRRIPVALTFARPGRYLLRVQVTESGRAVVSRVTAVIVRR